MRETAAEVQAGVEAETAEMGAAELEAATEVEAVVVEATEVEAAAEVDAAEMEAAEVEAAAEVETAEVEVAGVDAAEKEAATEVEVAAAEVEAVWQRVVGVLGGRSRELRGFRVGMQVVLMRAQKGGEAEEGDGLGGWSWLEQMVQYVRWLEAQQEWVEAADEQEVQQRKHEEKAADKQQMRQQKRQQRKQQKST